MNKNTGARTATTFTLADQHPNFASADPEMLAAITAPYTWKTEQGAREAVEMMETQGHEHTVHYAPGLEVHAFYVNGAMLTIIVFEDRTAAKLHRAVRKAQPVTVSYVKADGEETVRTVEPTALKTTKAGDVIVQAVDRKSAETRSFRLDRITAYTIHRTAFTARTERPAPTKAQLWEQWLNRPAADGVEAITGPVRHTRHGFTGTVVPGTRAYGPTGWSVIVKLDDPTLAVGGTTRASESELEAADGVEVLDNLTGEIKVIPREAYDRLLAARDPREPKAADERLRDSLSTTPGTADALEAPEAVQDALADAYARGESYLWV